MTSETDRPADPGQPGNGAGDGAHTFRDGVHDLAGEARTKARDGAEYGKQAVAGGLGDFAAAVRKASDELGSRDQSMASHLVREVAGGLEQASRSIHGSDLGELTRSVGRFARERPAVFLVGAALAGLALGRFARSSGDHADDPPGAAPPFGSTGDQHAGGVDGC